MKTKLILSVIFLLAMVSITSAQSKTPVVTKRQFNQQKRIQNGIQNGSLTKLEVKQLEKQQVNILKTKKVVKADGNVTKRERAILHHKQNNASTTIFIQKHDRQNRY